MKRIIKTLDRETTIFTVSEYTKNSFLKKFDEFIDNKIIVNYLAVDKNKYYKIEEGKLDDSVLDKYDISKNSKYFLTLSSLNTRKNLSFLIDCFVKFLEINPEINDLNLVLAGPKGWLIDDMFESIKNADKYKNKIILTGFIDESDINTVYNGAFSFVFPSLAEGFGLPVLEALQCGVPVISSNTTSLPEVYADAAISIDPRNEEGLINAMHDIYYDDELRNELTKKGLEQAKKFSWVKTTKTMINEYLNIINEGKNICKK